LLYPDLFKSLEAARWNMADDVPWDQFNRALLTDEHAYTIKMNAITEWAALPATEMFMRDFRDDSDFSAFMSIWFYEEQKHALVLMEYLKRFRPELTPTEAELHAVRFEFDPAPPLEPVIKHIYDLLSRDEARHGGAYLKFMRRAIERDGLAASSAFAKVGVLMASSGRSGKPLHPTNLHVNKTLYPKDTIQSHLPDPDWLERWLDGQMHFDKACEARVIGGILRNLSSLFNRKFDSVADLNRYRKSLAASVPHTSIAS
jgi:hypothetical protein